MRNKRYLVLALFVLVGLLLVACDQTPTTTDTGKPVITGTKNRSLVVGDEEPNWLDGVSATDDVDGEVNVTVDASDVNLDAVGTYELIYSATDAAGNRAEIKVTVTVVAGVSDTHHIIFGDDPFDGTATTGVAGVGIALYYDATEDGLLVDYTDVTFIYSGPPEDLFPTTLEIIPILGGYYIRPGEPGTYTLTLRITDSQGNIAEADVQHQIVVASGDTSTEPATVKALVRSIYPDNIAANPDYGHGEPTASEYMIVGKDFVKFDRQGGSNNYAVGFIGYGDFDGEDSLLNFELSFKYQSTNDIWKLLFSFWSGEKGAGNDGWAGDWLRILTNRDQIGIQGDAKQDSEFQDEGEATNIPLSEEAVYIKFIREVSGTTVNFRLYTSLDGNTYTLQTTAIILNASTSASGLAAPVTGFLPFSIDNDFIISQLQMKSYEGEDTIDPVIHGTRDWILTEGDEKPNWLSGVTVTDNVDNDLEIEVDDSDVDLTTAGTYQLIYSATDNAGNNVIVTVNVTVNPQSEDGTLIVFGEDPFDDSATTSLTGVGVALYYDATEEDLLVDYTKVDFLVEQAGAIIQKVPEKDQWYFRASQAGTYTIVLRVTDSNGDIATAEEKLTIVVIEGENKDLVRSIYPDNIAANPDYRVSEGTLNQYLVVGKNYVVFDRGGSTNNYAAGFIGFADFENSEALEDFTIAFKYETLNTNWKLVFSMFTGEIGADGYAGDWLRILTNRDQIGIQGDTQQGSNFQDDGEATDIPLQTQSVWIKLTRTILEDTVTFRLYTSVDGQSYTLQTTAVSEDALANAGGLAGKLTGIVLFSIDNDFIVEDLVVSSEVFSLV